MVMCEWQIESFQRRMTLIRDMSVLGVKGIISVGASKSDFWGNAANTGETKANWRSVLREIISTDYTD